MEYYGVVTLYKYHSKIRIPSELIEKHFSNVEKFVIKYEDGKIVIIPLEVR